MVALMQWWLTAKPSDAPARGLLELIREGHIKIIQQQSDGRLISK
jgi:hypothetical protein